MSAPPAAPETFRTARLDAERLAASHLDDILRMHRDARMMEALGGVRDAERTRAYMASNLAHWEAHGFGLYILRPAGGGEAIGRAGLRRLEIDAVDEVELAYALCPEAWGRGLATEIAGALVSLGLGPLGRASIVSLTAAPNQASRRVLLKTGFAPEREIVHHGRPRLLYRTSPLARGTW